MSGENSEVSPAVVLVAVAVRRNLSSRGAASSYICGTTPRPEQGDRERSERSDALSSVSAQDAQGFAVNRAVTNLSRFYVLANFI